MNDKQYVIRTNYVNWQCGDGCCSSSWHEGTLLLKSADKELFLYTCDWGDSSYGPNEDSVIENLKEQASKDGITLTEKDPYDDDLPGNLVLFSDADRDYEDYGGGY